MDSKILLRGYQTDAVNRLRFSLSSGRKAPILVLPTGGGKTIIFTYIAEQAQRRGKRVFILVHRAELLQQASRALASLGVPHGRIKSGQTWTRDSIQVASVDTLIRRLDKVQPPDLIIVDEGHHLVEGNKWGRVVEAFPEAVILGVTATPVRLDGAGLGKGEGGYYDDMIVGPSISDLIDAGYLTEPVVYAPPSEIDLSGVKMRGGDFEAKELGKRVDKPKITGDAVAHYRQLCPREPAIVFCVTVDHAKHVAEKFTEAGYNAVSLDGTNTDRERKEAIEQLSDGRLNVITSCELISEGTDIPVVSAAILLRPTASESLFLQQVGRALRPFPGKHRAVILDHVGNVLRHGLPEEPRLWTLLGRKKRGRGQPAQENAVGVMRCLQCFAVYRNSAPCCPQCGAVPPEIKRTAPEHSDGELKKIEAAQANVERRRQIAAAQSFEQLQEIAKQRGYKPGWAQHIWDARQKRRSD